MPTFRTGIFQTEDLLRKEPNTTSLFGALDKEQLLIEKWHFETKIAWKLEMENDLTLQLFSAQKNIFLSNAEQDSDPWLQDYVSAANCYEQLTLLHPGKLSLSC